MSEKRISYICIYCGEKSRRRVSMGEPPEEVCPKRKGGEMHVWIDSHEVSKEYRIKFQKSKYPIAEYMYYYTRFPPCVKPFSLTRKISFQRLSKLTKAAVFRILVLMALSRAESSSKF